MLAGLPAEFGVPIMLVQVRSPRVDDQLPLVLQSRTALPVRHIAQPPFCLGPTAAGSVDVEHGFAGDCSVQQCLDGGTRLPPGLLEFDLTVQSAVNDQLA